ncbi:hypothetical protein GGF48_002953 [Coemansia sp. RSA 921]|nr:hypothetical protein GGF48_002953 [Coemansia sp. RSA 921]KAJ2182926.1 hypothetical protein GGF45_000488 [Coemansia sp. RSA 551]KAJ2277769.1 hypothetical protein EV176_001999 [Coemansia sp. RSA 451]
MNFVLRRFVQWVKSLPGTRGHRMLWLPRSASDYMLRMRGAQHYKHDIPSPPPVLIWSIFSAVTSFISIMTLGLIHKYGSAIHNHNLPFAIAPAGASAVLIFAVPASPLAQPRNVIVGHIIAALVGTFAHALFLHVEDSLRWLSGALAVSVAIGLMGLTNCYHPPAGATAFIGGYFGPDIERVGWWYPLFPVLPVAFIMVGIGLILNNMCRVYPVYWFTPVHVRRPHDSIEAGAKTEDVETGPESNASNAENDVNDETGNEMEAEMAWLRARVRELERETHVLRHDHRISQIRTAIPDIA